MRADAHLHLFRDGFPGRYGKGPYGAGQEVATYERFRVAHDIVVGLVVGFEGDGIEPGNNAYVRGLAATRPWMATLAYLDAAASPGAAAIEALIGEGHAGITLYLRQAPLTEAVLAWPKSGWEALDARGAVISLNAVPEATAALAPLIAANRGCHFLFSHLGLPGRYPNAPSSSAAAERLAPLLGLARLPNVLVKISGLYAISDPPHLYPHEAAFTFIELLLDRFGPERCAWGSDFSPALDFVSFPQAVAVPGLDRLTDSERDQVMGGNLLRVLGRV